MADQATERRWPMIGPPTEAARRGTGRWWLARDDRSGDDRERETGTQAAQHVRAARRLK